MTTRDLRSAAARRAPALPGDAPSALTQAFSRVALAALGGVMLAALAAPAPSAHAYSVSLAKGTSGNVVSWKAKTLQFSLHPDCSADLPTATCLNALRASFATWTTPACTGIAFSEQPASSNKKLTSVGYGTNGINELAFIENSQWQHGSYVLGVTSPWFYEDGSVFEADIAFNGYQQTWSTSDTPSSKQDVMNVAVHEIGHFFGLQHNLGGYSASNPPTMATTADPYLKSRTPEPDDYDGVCFLYPKSSFSCSADADCPLVVDDGPSGEYYAGHLGCGAGGLCGGVSTELPDGTGVLGDACVSDYDCAKPWFCQPLSGSDGVCASLCTPGAAGTCPSGFACTAFSNSPSEGVCLEDTGGGSTGGTKAPGQPCVGGSECASGLCVQESTGTFCRTVCTSNAQCPVGSECQMFPGAGYGACVEAQVGGGKANGEACGSSSECDSGLCVGGAGAGYYCAQGCNASGECPPDATCEPLSGGGGACFPKTETLPLGAACDGNGACDSDSCVSFDGIAWWCSKDCAQDADCPCGMACTQTTTGAICDAPGEKVACVPDGATCANSSECASGVCRKGVCEASCSIFQSGLGCGDASQGCQRLTDGAPDGYCRDRGPNAVGNPCGQDNACQSLLCHEGLCALPCNPFGAPGCPGGTVCVTASGQVGACVVAPDPGTPDAGGTGGDGTDAGPTAGGDDSTGGTPTPEDAGVAWDDISGGAGSGQTTPPTDDGCNAARRDAGPLWPVLMTLTALWALGRRRRALV